LDPVEKYVKKVENMMFIPLAALFLIAFIAGLVHTPSPAFINSTRVEFEEANQTLTNVTKHGFAATFTYEFTTTLGTLAPSLVPVYGIYYTASLMANLGLIANALGYARVYSEAYSGNLTAAMETAMRVIGRVMPVFVEMGFFDVLATIPNAASLGLVILSIESLRYKVLRRYVKHAVNNYVGSLITFLILLIGTVLIFSI
jgi:hypothetical protein